MGTLYNSPSILATATTISLVGCVQESDASWGGDEGKQRLTLEDINRKLVFILLTNLTQTKQAKGVCLFPALSCVWLTPFRHESHCVDILY